MVDFATSEYFRRKWPFIWRTETCYTVLKAPQALEYKCFLTTCFCFLAMHCTMVLHKDTLFKNEARKYVYVICNCRVQC